MSGSNTCSGLSSPNANFTPGSATGNVEIPFNNAPKQSLINDIDTAVGTLGDGWKAKITAHGGRNERASGTDNHPNGDAADIQLYYNGRMVSPNENPNAYQQVVRSFTGVSNSKGVRPGIGGYDNFVHLDQSPWRQRDVKADPAGTWGGKTWASQGIQQGAADAQAGNVNYYANQADGTSGEKPAGKPGEDLAAQTEAAKQGRTNCSPQDAGGGGGGCGPVTASAPGVAASLAQNQGLAQPQDLITAVTDVLAGKSSVKLDTIVNAAAAVTSGDPSRILSQTISPEVANIVKSVGSGNKLSGLIGAVAPSITRQLGITNPVLGRAISTVAGNILGGNKLKFANVFGLAQAAAGSALGLNRAQSQAVNLLFGTAARTLASSGSRRLGGYDNLDISEMNGSRTKELVGNLDEVMVNVNDGEPMAQFGSLYSDYNAMITQGFGSLSSNLNALGYDLIELGYMADMVDLFRIGTPGQICSQIILRGAGVGTGLLATMAEAGIDAKGINTFEADPIALDLLSAIAGEAEITLALDALQVTNREGLVHLGELCDPSILFPRSQEYNRFTNLNDMAPLLSMCGIGRITYLGELGRLFASMETMNDSTALNALEQPTTVEEIDYLQSVMSPTSHYSGNGDITVADFIGTAAGYGHTTTLPNILVNQETVWADPITTDLESLLDLQADALAGTYTSGAFVVIPSTGGYTFGTYGSLDDAVLAIEQAIGFEMDYIAENASDATSNALFDLQTAHEESVGQLWREEWLRQQHGIGISNDSKTVDRTYGDGSSLVFDITGPIASNNQVDVYIQGVYQNKDQFTVNSTTLTVTFTSAPASGVLIEIVYSTGMIAVTSSKKDAWTFATQLEDWGKKTGFGSEADFLFKVATDDVHGQRIKATMIQGRNKVRAESFGITCNGVNRLLSETTNTNPTGLVHFAEQTGIWSDDYVRAADLWLQMQDEAYVDRDAYYERRLESMEPFLRDNKDKLARDILDGLLFIAEDKLVISDAGITAYDTVDPTKGITNININTPGITREGSVLGPQDELVTAIMAEEGLKGKQDQYTTMPSSSTKSYLASINVNIKRLVMVMQAVMLSEICKTYGIAVADAKSIFGIPSVAKTLLYNATRLD